MTVVRSLPGTPDACWISRAPHTNFPKLENSLHADAIIIGAGIVGLTAALRLCEAGRSVIVLEARRVGTQVTGRSTAKITTQHGLIYQHLTETLGAAVARDYAEANLAGMRQIEEWIQLYAIACDLERKDAYVYAFQREKLSELEAEAQAARAAGLSAEVVDAPLPFTTAGALRFPDQAQFNPASYLVGLASAVTALGGRIFEQSPVVLVDAASRWRAVTEAGNAHADHVVVATNITIKSPLGMSKRTQPRMHTAMAFRIDAAIPLDGMFIGCEEPTHSIRTASDKEGRLLVVLGPKFNTGQDGDVARHFEDLEAWTRAHFPVGAAAWRWCNEDYDTADRLAFIGQPDPEKSAGFHIATGFNAWGISNGTAAGMLISDTIATGKARWTRLFDPARPSSTKFNRPGDSASRVASVADVVAGTGGVIRRGEEQLAVYKDEAGNLQVLSAACTHKGCIVTWNNADRTWDCPCHGSMFKPDGSVIHGPAKTPLAKAKL